MTSLILHPTANSHPHHGRGADLRSAALAVVWLALAAAVPLGAVFLAAAPQSASVSGAAHVAPYIEAKVGRP
jgi:hypothetical protein